MLLQFNVKNFMSIRDEIVLSLQANSDKKHEDFLLLKGTQRVLPSIAIYGANAAGKSNIFKALTRAIMLVRKSNEIQINTKTGIFPFYLDDNSRNEKTKIDFKFIHNNIKYDYGFEADQNKIYNEYLYEYKTSRPTLIFERTDIINYKFTVANSSLKQYTTKNADNKLFLSTATAWNCELTRNAFMWFVENIDVYSALTIQNDNIYYEEMDKHRDDPNYEKLLLEMLKHADINITGYDFSSRDVQDKTKITPPPGVTFDENLMKELLKDLKEYKLTTHHLIETKNGNKDYTLDIHFESNGTKLMFAYAPIIIDAIYKGRTIVIDEIDNSMHPMLLSYIIGIFNDNKYNKNGAQIIFNTHDVNLLDLDKFRRDQIYFVEKNNTNGVTDLYSLADYSPRNSENIRKGYLQGRYGAIPAIIGGYEWIKE